MRFSSAFPVQDGSLLGDLPQVATVIIGDFAYTLWYTMPGTAQAVQLFPNMAITREWYAPGTPVYLNLGAPNPFDDTQFQQRRQQPQQRDPSTVIGPK